MRIRFIFSYPLTGKCRYLRPSLLPSLLYRLFCCAFKMKKKTQSFGDCFFFLVRSVLCIFALFPLHLQATNYNELHDNAMNCNCNELALNSFKCINSGFLCFLCSALKLHYNALIKLIIVANSFEKQFSFVFEHQLR